MLDDRLRAWTHALCSEPCAGRRAGSPEGAATRLFLRAAFLGLGLEPRAQRVPVVDGENLWARIGQDGRRVVLLGAHHDHLGRGPHGPYWGADDNAAAVALLLEVGRALAADPPAGGDVLLVAFDAEESPFVLGSTTFAEAPPVPLADVALMIALDLVGHAIGPPDAPAEVRESLFALGAEKSGTGPLVDEAAAGVAGVRVRRLGIDVIPPLSDYHPFREAGVPFLFLTAGRWRHYHRETDTPDRLDYGKLAATTRFVERLVRGALAAPAAPRFDDDARDDGATLDGLAAILAPLAERQPRAHAALGLLEGIRARIRDGRCGDADWEAVLGLVAALEGALA